MKTLPACALASTLLFAACASNHNTSLPHPAMIDLANPASVFCLQQGGQLRMASTPAGVHGMCALPNGREVEEWVLFRQHHPNPAAP